MAIDKIDQETIINWNEEINTKATIESPLKSMWTKLEKYGAVHLMDYKYDDKITSKVYEIPKSWIHIHPPKQVSETTKKRLVSQTGNKGK